MSTPYRRTAALVAGVVTTALLAVPAQAAPPVRVTLPGTSGHHLIGTTDLHLVDGDRADPWHPADRREVMVTVTYPAQRGGERAPWLSPGAARVQEADVADAVTGPVDWAGTRRQARTNAPVERGRWPVVLFSPGFGMAREVNATITDDLASHGYVVVSMSHTHESRWVEFPGGRMVEGTVAGDAGTFGTALDVRVADTRFTLDELTRLARGANPDAERDPLPRGLSGALDLTSVGVLGHSYGGFTAAETMYRDRRFDAGVNLDGGIAIGGDGEPGDAAKHGLDRPFMLVGADSTDPATGQRSAHTHLDPSDPSWALFWANQRGWKRDLHFSGAAHLGFTDYQVAIPRLARVLKPGVAESVIGTIDPAKSAAAQHEYLSAFFDLHLKHRDRGLFDRDDPRYPATRFVR
ncbi:lipase [Saccharothrix violaceirubra]|uniref:Putative dienelactone hydrolase n=1 Tax=Saccharothrix violaceirubra TaxID=413306 RepID=A0A7W7T2S3_9PSEU|nr:lipase [Saccharothrix violaceirubra]MBB4965451.1 putative dienelactone hydrolase [Saccharothrix violaceirubra]